ncbi:hypothetical protein L9F63_006317, partial [Diploptera punctata]
TSKDVSAGSILTAFSQRLHSVVLYKFLNSFVAQQCNLFLRQYSNIYIWYLSFHLSNQISPA